MIANKDRSNYIGASDTKYVIGNWNTKTFENWWLKKIGIDNSNINNKYTMAGTYYEHKIIDSLNIKNLIKDTQIIIGRLRVNLDANNDEEIHEIKTYQYEKGFDINKHKDYINQVQVQMYASNIHKAYIDAYGLLENEYDNYFIEIDKNRLMQFEIIYDENWINKIYLPRYKTLEYCLINGIFPNERMINNENN